MPNVKPLSSRLPATPQPPDPPAVAPAAPSKWATPKRPSLVPPAVPPVISSAPLPPATHPPKSRTERLRDLGDLLRDLGYAATGRLAPQQIGHTGPGHNPAYSGSLRLPGFRRYWWSYIMIPRNTTAKRPNLK